MLPPPAYIEARLLAKFHVQVEIEPSVVDATPAYLPVRGRVRRVFRGGSLEPGAELRFTVPVCRRGDEIMPGGDLWMYHEQFQGAKYMEVFLDGTPPECKLACSQCSVVAGLSDLPQLAVPTEEEVAAAWERLRAP